jgi:hypothetical protein
VWTSRVSVLHGVTARYDRLTLARGPMREAVLDGEPFSGTGMNGIDGILTARQRVGGDVSFLAFDLLQLGGWAMMAEPWVDRRKRLEDLFAGEPIAPQLALVPAAFDDARRLWGVGVVEWGGEGIVFVGVGYVATEVAAGLTPVSAGAVQNHRVRAPRGAMVPRVLTLYLLDQVRSA